MVRSPAGMPRTGAAVKAAKSAGREAITQVATARRERKSLAERREDILTAALPAFARGGLAGTSTEEIARNAGISHAYLFRVFPSKRALFIASMERCFDRVVTAFTRASEGLTGEDALCAIGETYRTMLSDRDLLLSQLHSYAAASDPEVQAAARIGYGKVVAAMSELSGAPPDRILLSMAMGMFVTVAAALELTELHDPWCQALMGAYTELTEWKGT